MRISTTKKTPSTKEMAEILQQEFHYSYKLFGLGVAKSIIVQKSTFVGVQVIKSENYITVEGTYPSIATSFFSALAFYFDYRFFIPKDTSREWKTLEVEIGTFLSNQYT